MQKKGFTLVELIAVIAIMSALIVIAGVNIYKFRDSANKKSLTTIVTNIETATELYIEANSNDIIAKCKGTDQSKCICENTTDLTGRESFPYTCKITLKKLLEKGIYNNIDSTSACITDRTNNPCCITNPLDNTCLDDRIITITIKTYTSNAELEI